MEPMFGAIACRTKLAYSLCQ